MLSSDWLPSRELDAESLERVAKLAALPKTAHIHIAGVCGTGTASVLQLLKACGFRVTGSDKAFYPPMGDVVRAQCDKVYEGYSADNLAERPDCVIIGNALSKGNPEVQHVLANDIPFASMPETFAALLIGSREHCPRSVVVAGTHGKTTTTAAVATLFELAGRKPGFFVGGMPKNLPGSLRRVDETITIEDRVVVLEGDEYDSAFFAKYSKFHSYRPDIAIITSIEFDHADIFQSVEDIELEFTRFVRRIPKDGLILVADEGERLDLLVPKWKTDPEIVAPIHRYGAREDSHYRILSRNPRRDGVQGQQLQLSVGGELLICRSPMSGAHNAQNLLAAAAVAQTCGLQASTIAQGVAGFEGVLRRQHVVDDIGGITVIEDFAHHPTAIKVTLEGLRESYGTRRIIAVFEPRSNTSRRAVFQDVYPGCFESADVVVIQDVVDAGGYTGTSSPVVVLDVQKVITDLEVRGKEAALLKTADDIISFITNRAQSGDVIVLMSNGDFGGLPKSLPEALKRTTADSTAAE